MPSATYEQLLVDTMPQAIESEAQYDALAGRFGGLVGKGRRRSTEETKLMHLLGVLIADYDRRQGLSPDDSTAAEKLAFLLEHSGKPPAALLPVFGQRSHVHEALTGKRNISATQARKLGVLFHVSPGLFI